MPDDQHLPAHALREYRLGQLPPSEMLSVSDHLANCAECRDALARIDSGPVYEELAAAVDGALDPTARTDLTARLADAPGAAAEFEALQRFKQEMASQAGRVYAPSDPSATARDAENRIVTPPIQIWGRKAFPFIGLAAALMLLAVGWSILHRPKPPAEEIALLTRRDGRRVEPSALPADLREALERTLRTGHLERNVPDALRPPGARLAGPTRESTASFHLLGPVGTMVLDSQPILSWTALPEATAYVVTLSRLDGTDARSSPELPATRTAWTPPDALQVGVVYTWQVEALRAGETLAKTPLPSEPEARFQVLDTPQRKELFRIGEQFGDNPLVAAVACTRAGLEQEAARQWFILALEHPDSALALRLWHEAQAAQSPSPINTKGAQ